MKNTIDWITRLTTKILIKAHKLEFKLTDEEWNTRKNKQLEKHIEIILIQFLKSKETEKITKKFNEEIIPEVIKLRPKIQDKLDLENIIQMLE